MNVTRSDVGLLALRLVLGAAFVVHGFPKIRHPATWAIHVLPGTPAPLAAVAAIVEFVGGIAIALGFGTQIAGFLIAADMVVAIFFALLPNGAAYVASEPGARSFELPLAYLAIAFSLVLTGAGRISIDAARSRGNGRDRIGSRTGGRGNPGRGKRR
jgi:putative oxidoreductase